MLSGLQLVVYLFSDIPILEDISAAEHELKPFWMQPFFYRLLRNTTVLQMAVSTDVPCDGNCFFHCVSDQQKRLGMPSKLGK